MPTVMVNAFVHRDRDLPSIIPDEWTGPVSRSPTTSSGQLGPTAGRRIRSAAVRARASPAGHGGRTVAWARTLGVL